MTHSATECPDWKGCLIHSFRINLNSFSFFERELVCILQTYVLEAAKNLDLAFHFIAHTYESFEPAIWNSMRRFVIKIHIFYSCHHDMLWQVAFISDKSTLRYQGL